MILTGVCFVSWQRAGVAKVARILAVLGSCRSRAVVVGDEELSGMPDVLLDHANRRAVPTCSPRVVLPFFTANLNLQSFLTPSSSSRLVSAPPDLVQKTLTRSPVSDTLAASRARRCLWLQQAPDLPGSISVM